ncbi:MAG: DUF5011 domain-containing protein [Candidatus Pacebacteria bacterium]|nr:DUF5011 domain-containing protein [Candidatus Paceibacterota bacterium]
MFDQIIDLIKESVTTVVALAVGVLGLGDAALFNPDVVPPAEDIKISEDLPAGEAGLSDNADIFETQLASISQALQGDEGGGFAAAPTESADGALALAENTQTAVENETQLAPLLTSTEPEIRPINPIKSTKQTKPVDVSSLLKEDFDKFDANLQITKIIEDGGNFYVNYQFLSYGIKNKIWTKILKEKKMLVSETLLGEKNLSAYLSEELGEVLDNEIVFLKEVQEIQKVKQAKTESAAQGAQTISSKYSALIGRVLDVNNEQFGDYIPVATEEKTDNLINDGRVDEEKTDNLTNDGRVDNEAPIIIIQGNNPALIQIGSSYIDLGAKAVDNISNNLDVKISGDLVNTEVKGSYFVIYTATDEAGNVATATREVIVYDYGAAPEVKQIEKPAAPEPLIEIVTEKPLVKINAEPAAEEKKPAAVIEKKEIIATTTEIAADETATTTIMMADETATTTAPAASSASVIETIKEAAAKTIDTTLETSGAVVEGVVEGGKKAGRKIGEKTKEAVEIISETTEAAAETISETSAAALEQVSKALETVTEEVSAMIKKVHFMELLGNIRSALQSSVVVAGEGTTEIFELMEQFLRPAAENTYLIINSAARKTYGALINIWQKIGINQAIARISDRVIANISDYKKENDLFVKEENFEPDGTVGFEPDRTVGFEYSEYQERNFTGFVFGKTIEIAITALDKTINLASALTATVRDFGGIVSSDLKDVGAEVDQKINETDFSVKALLNFFRNHRPL